MGSKVTNYTKVYVLLALTLVALVLVVVATFIDGWWEQRGELVVDTATGQRNCTLVRKTFSLWERVHCSYVNDVYVCLLNDSDNTDWILFVRCTCVFAVFLVSVMVLLQVGFLCTNKPILSFFAAVFSILTGVVSFITSFVILGMFNSISSSLLTVPSRARVSCETLRYQTLPLGFLFFTGFLANFIATGLSANVDKKARPTKFTGFGSSDPVQLRTVRKK